MPSLRDSYPAHSFVNFNTNRRTILTGVVRVAAATCVMQRIPLAFSRTCSFRIAAPDRAGAQTLLALGKVPIASVSRDFFNEMGTIPAMPEGVVDCGASSEPNLEVLQGLDVNLIVIGTISVDIRDILRRVAPVVALEIYTGRDGTLVRAKNETLRLANLIGRGKAGRAYVDRIEEIIFVQRSRLRQPRRPVFLVGLAADGRNMTVYARNSIMFDVMQAMDVENAWAGSTNAFGFVNAGVEELAANPDASIVHIDYGAETNAALETLARSPLWTALPAVRAGRVYRIPRFEVFGGLPLAAQFAPLLADTLLKTRPV